MKTLRTKIVLAVLVVTSPVLDVPWNIHAKPAPVAVGFIAGIEGRGYIVRERDTRGRGTIVISGMDLIYPSDVIQLPRGSSARISICRGRGIVVRGDARFIVRGSGLAFTRGRASGTYAVDKKICAAALEVFRENDNRLRDMVAGEKKGTLALKSRTPAERRGVYVVRGRGRLPAIELYSNRVLPRRPLIIWRPVAGRAAYRIAVTRAGMTLWRGQAEKNSCMYPDNAPALMEQEVYTVAIEAVDGKGDVIAQGSDFLSIFSKGDEDAFARDESSIRALLSDSAPEVHILAGKLYEAHGLLPDAVASYEKAVSLGGGNPGLLERIKLLKNEME